MGRPGLRLFVRTVDQAFFADHHVRLASSAETTVLRRPKPVELPAHDRAACYMCLAGHDAWFIPAVQEWRHFDHGKAPPSDLYPHAIPLPDPPQKDPRRECAMPGCTSKAAVGAVICENPHTAGSPQLFSGSPLRVMGEYVMASPEMIVETYTPNPPPEDAPVPPAPAPKERCLYARIPFSPCLWTDREYAEVERQRVECKNPAEFAARMHQFRAARLQVVRGRFQRTRREWPECKFGGTIRFETERDPAISAVVAVLVCSKCGAGA